MAAAPIRRALLSVTDKSGLQPLASALAARGVELLSTGGTARQLREWGLPVTDVADYTGFPEVLGGRVKTLHPKVCRFWAAGVVMCYRTHRQLTRHRSVAHAP